jgi:thiamine biosynthesis lipoprotein
MADPTKTTRRDFLSGKSAAEALGDALIGPPQPLPTPTSVVGVQPGSHLLSVSREAMACLFEVVFDATKREATESAVAALELVATLEDQLTIYRDTSEVAGINRRAFDQPVEVESGLFGLLQRAVTLSEATGGAFDITAGQLSKVWGFFRRQGLMPAESDVVEALATIGSQYLELDEAAHAIRFQKAGLELNLGAIGKGYALDRATDSLIASGLNDFLIHGGNSSVLARGDRLSDLRFGFGGSATESDLKSQIPNHKSQISPGWSIALRHPLKPDIRLAEFFLHNQALGTSGSGTQFFHHQGKRYGHIINPRTGWPADQVLSATVIAPTAEQSDALSTAFYVAGLELAEEYCRQHPDISALLTTQTGTAGIELHPVNLPEVRWRRL